MCFIIWLVHIIIHVRKQENRLSDKILLAHWIIQGVLLIGLLLSKFWKVEIIKPLMYLTLIRIYLALFQENRVFEKDDAITLFYYMFWNMV